MNAILEDPTLEDTLAFPDMRSDPMGSYSMGSDPHGV